MIVLTYGNFCPNSLPCRLIWLTAYSGQHKARYGCYTDMETIKIHVLHCGLVHTSPYLPFDTGRAGMLKVAGIGVPAKDWVWMPVSAYYIEHPKAKILVDTGWSRRMSPEGLPDKKAQIAELGRLLYTMNQGYLPAGEAVDEQLKNLGVNTSDLDYVILTHLDCDHVCGVRQVADARHILVSEAEMKFVRQFSLTNKVRFRSQWWKGVPLELFPWNGNEGPFGRSFDLLGDKSVQLINIPGHTEGLVAVKITNGKGKYVLIDSDGAYGSKSWQDMILPGIADNRREQLLSLQWIREMSMNGDCVESLANHDVEIKPHIIEL